jgi:hypothetical protein
MPYACSGALALRSAALYTCVAACGDYACHDIYACMQLQFRAGPRGWFPVMHVCLTLSAPAAHACRISAHHLSSSPSAALATRQSWSTALWRNTLLRTTTTITPLAGPAATPSRTLTPLWPAAWALAKLVRAWQCRLHLCTLHPIHCPSSHSAGATFSHVMAPSGCNC